MPGFIRVMRYDFDSYEGMLAHLEGNNFVPWNGSKKMGDTMRFESVTMLADDEVSIKHVKHQVQQRLFAQADLVVAVTQETGELVIVKQRHNAPFVGLEFP